MIRNDQQGSGLREWVIPREQCRIDVAVRADERQGARLLVHRARSLPNCGVGIEEPIVVQLELEAFHVSASQRVGNSLEIGCSSARSRNLAICSQSEQI